MNIIRKIKRKWAVFPEKVPVDTSWRGEKETTPDNRPSSTKLEASPVKQLHSTKGNASPVKKRSSTKTETDNSPVDRLPSTETEASSVKLFPASQTESFPVKRVHSTKTEDSPVKQLPIIKSETESSPAKRLPSTKTKTSPVKLLPKTQNETSSENFLPYTKRENYAAKSPPSTKLETEHFGQLSYAKTRPSHDNWLPSTTLEDTPVSQLQPTKVASPDRATLSTKTGGFFYPSQQPVAQQSQADLNTPKAVGQKRRKKKKKKTKSRPAQLVDSSHGSVGHSSTDYGLLDRSDNVRIESDCPEYPENNTSISQAYSRNTDSSYDNDSSVALYEQDRGTQTSFARRLNQSAEDFTRPQSSQDALASWEEHSPATTPLVPNRSFDPDLTAKAVKSGVVLRPKARGPRSAFFSAPKSSIDERSQSSGDVHSAEAFTRGDSWRHSQSDQRVVGKVTPRLVKSQSHHGTLVVDGTGLNRPFSERFHSGRRILSQAELEYLRQSQVFRMLQGLQILPLESKLQELPFPMYGREDDRANVCDILEAPGRVVTLTGCTGNGKSCLAVAVAQELANKLIVSVHIDLRACVSVESIRMRLVDSFGCKFKELDMTLFYNWLNSHDTRLLIILDNMELPLDYDGGVSCLIDELVCSVKNLRVLCTCVRPFFKGHSTSETYRVGDIPEHAEEVLRNIIPDCHDEGIRALAQAADYNLASVIISGRAFSMHEVDSGCLFEDLTVDNTDGPFVAKTKEPIEMLTTDEMDRQKIFKSAVVLKTVIQNLPDEERKVLEIMHLYPADFNLEDAKALVAIGDENRDTKVVLEELVKLQLVTTCNGQYTIPRTVLLTLRALYPRDGTKVVEIIKQIIDKLKACNKLYHSRNAFEALKKFELNFDNFVFATMWILDREEAFEYCGFLADLEYSTFLYICLPGELYEELYDGIARQAEDVGQSIVRANSLCCLVLKHLDCGQYGEARTLAEEAHHLLQTALADELQKAFCVLCLGKVYCHLHDLKEKGLTLVKCSLDIYKVKLGTRHVKTLYANESYGALLMDRDNYQKARHIFNMSDLVLNDVLGQHPSLIQSNDYRLAIWDKLNLFDRSIKVAEANVRIAKLFYGDHSITAYALAKHCDCILKGGSMSDAVSVAVECVRVCSKIFGNGNDTARAYKVLAFVMLRTGQLDQAQRFGQCALEIYEQIKAPEKVKIEVRNIMTQAYYKFESRSNVNLSKRTDHVPYINGSIPESPARNKVNDTSLSTDV